MVTKVDRLPDWAHTKEELNQLAKLVIEPIRYDTTSKHICWYHLYKDGISTGKAMLLAVESIVDGRDAINQVCANIGLTAQIGEYGKESPLNGIRAQALYMVLDKYQYIGKLEFIGSNKVYTYENWMSKLV
jgi:hypothetical protein